MGCLRPEPWYGADPYWRYTLQRDAMRLYGRHLSVEHRNPAYYLGSSIAQISGQVVYRHSGIDVVGRTEPVPVEIRFYSHPPYSTYGLAAEDYPRVFADPGARSKHRMEEDDALCLYHPEDAPERRWKASDGLLLLLDQTAEHLFLEAHWRTHDDWLSPEASHGRAA